MPDTAVIQVRRALLSVSDKTGLIDFARGLHDLGVELVSTGGTFRALNEAGLPAIEVSSVTAFPEMMDGRVKTLHPKIHGGILGRRDVDQQVMEEHGIEAIDLVCVNLYPFKETIANPEKTHDDAIENIDIGGPAMVRSAAKNHQFVGIVTSPDQYAMVLGELAGGGLLFSTRQQLATAAFQHTAEYDGAIANYLGRDTDAPQYPDKLFLNFDRASVLRYGENPHQSAAFYRDPNVTGSSVGASEQLAGKALSFNNIADTDAALECVRQFDAPACVIVKHANPCGVARGASLTEAYLRAFDCDRTSAFGGIIAFNQPLDGATAEEITKIFTEVVIAPGADEEARAIFAAKKNLRLLTTDALADPKAAAMTIRQVSGGYLVQDTDNGQIDLSDLKVVTKLKPSDAQLTDLLFAWKVAKHVKSNAIVYVNDGATVGIGAGQMSRVDSSRIAARKAQDMADILGLAQSPAIGSVLASDAFFPFPDGLLSAAEAGAKAVIQPGGSMRDEEVIAAADEAGLAMVFTGMRHFRH